MENNTENMAPTQVAPEAAMPAEKPPQPPKQGGSSVFKWLFLGLLAIFLVAGGIGVGMWMSESKNTAEDKVTPTLAMKKPSPTLTQTMPSVGPTETEEVTPTESEQEQAKAAIKAAFAAKFDKRVDEVNITISDYQPSFAKGGVTFAGEMGGGWFLAAEVGGTWVIADDGNGTITCEKIEPYNFPVSMVSECWSEDTQEIIYR